MDATSSSSHAHVSSISMGAVATRSLTLKSSFSAARRMRYTVTCGAPRYSDASPEIHATLPTSAGPMGPV